MGILKGWRRAAALVAVAVGAALAAAGLDAAGNLTGLRALEDLTLDLRQRTTSESLVPALGGRESEIVLVMFDELSVLDPDFGWPWISPFPRGVIADVVDALTDAGARTIGLDVYLDRLFPGLDAMDQGNARLRDAIERAGNVVLAAPVERGPDGPTVTPPHPYFADVAADVGAAELPAAFETFRDGALAVRSEGGLEPSFALALWARSRGTGVDSILDEAHRTGRLELPGLPRAVGRVPEDGSIVPFRVRYLGPPSSPDAEAPPGTFPTFASGTVPVTASFAPELFRDKIVLVGTGFHDEDKFRTPFYGALPTGTPGSGTGSAEGAPSSGGVGAAAAQPLPYTWMFGVELHANALQNMLDGAYVRPMSDGGKAGLLLVVALVAAGATFLLGAAWGGVGTLAAVLGVIAWAFWRWAGVVYLPGVEVLELGASFVWVPVAAPALSALLSYVGSVGWVSIVEGREKRFIKSAFGKYLSPDVVAEIADDPASLALGGQTRPLTILFSDLSGFTSLSERLDAEALVALLNEYLDEMTRVVLDERGYLDKYIGDAIMAFWNAPRDVPDHAERALRAAVTMQRGLRDLNARWRANEGGRPRLRARIGVHTGDAVVGNVGGKDRFDYSAIGDAVNLAARLEPANDTYGTAIIASRDALEAAGMERFLVRELDLVRVKGKSRPVVMYEVIELAGTSLPSGRTDALASYREGIEAYRARDWETARARFQAALTAWPGDGPSELYLSRCEQHLVAPPPDSWDYVVQRTEK